MGTAASAASRPATWIRWRRSTIPAIGYGIRYEFGIFDQAIRDGWQVELTDKWLRFGNPWEIARPEISYRRRASADAPSTVRDEHGRYRVRWIPERVVKGVAYDTPMLGYRVAHDEPAAPVEGGSGRVVRLRRVQRRRLLRRGRGEDRVGEHHQGALSERRAGGRQAAAARAAVLLRLVLAAGHDPAPSAAGRGRSTSFDAKWAAQLNDTHPAIAVAELMRLLVDEHGMDWEHAWEITQRTFAYTNHTLLPEALEKWPLALFGRVLPRHLEIIYEINRRFLDEVRDAVSRRRGALRRAVAHRRDRRALRPHGAPRLRRQPRRQRRGRAAHRAAQGRPCCAISTSSGPQKFFNVTNGVTPRRWLALSNPGLARAHHQPDRRRLDRATSRRARRSSSRSPTTPRSATTWRAVKAAEQGRARRHSSRQRPAIARRSGVAVRRPGEAHPRVQAAAPERAAPRHALPAPASATRGATSRRARSSSAARPRPAIAWPS